MQFNSYSFSLILFQKFVNRPSATKKYKINLSSQKENKRKMLPFHAHQK